VLNSLYSITASSIEARAPGPINAVNIIGFFVFLITIGFLVAVLKQSFETKSQGHGGQTSDSVTLLVKVLLLGAIVGVVVTGLMFSLSRGIIDFTFNT
jgi:hypothetical protein